MAPEGGLALADLGTGRPAAGILHLQVDRLHVVLQMVLFVEHLVTDGTGKLAAARGGHHLDCHVGVQQSCKRREKKKKDGCWEVGCFINCSAARGSAVA